MLTNIQPQEFAVIVGKDRGQLFINGISLAGQRCSVLRDLWHDESAQSLDVRTKSTEGPTFSIVIIRTNKCIVILKGGDNVHGGALNQKCFDTIKYLRCAGY
ncbi:profilin-1-like [Gastrophryne carolinensis]